MLGVLTRVIPRTALFLAALFLVPIVGPAPAAAQSTAITVTGSVADGSGAPVAGADVALNGPQHYTTTTDAKGAFTLSNVTQGVYELRVTKPGYATAVQSDLALLPGQTQNLSVRMDLLTFSSLRTIANVRSNGRTAINTSPASVNVVTTQTFIDQAQPQVNRVLDQIPGLQNSYPSNSTNGASPGSITVPNIRAAESYETASLIDGHPISVGQYGDNVTTFLNSFMFGAVEVVKGPGAESPVVNNAIGGTVNFRTKDPSLTPTGGILYGVSSYGGTFSNFDFSNTFNNRLGVVADFATVNDPSVLNGKQVCFDPSGGFLNSDGTALNGNTGYANVGNTQSNIAHTFGLVACGYGMKGAFDQTAELLKLRYKLSSATNVTVSYLDAQTTADQNANTSAFYYNSQFAPGAGYTGSLAAGAVPVANIYPGAYQGEINTEPVFQAEGSTTFGNNTLLARYYRASIERYQMGGQTPNPDFNNVTLYGTNYDGNGNPIGTFNGTPETVGFFDLYQEPEIDKLSGGSIEFQHPFGNNNLLTLSADRTIANSTDYSVYNGFPGYFYSFGIPNGTWQMLTTYMARDHAYLGTKLEATLTDYFNTYSSTYATNCVNCSSYGAVVNGTGVSFATTKNSHNDPRLSLVYRLNGDSSLRAAAGSAIAPPFLGLLSQLASAPVYTSPPGIALESASNGNLKPETAFGWDLGGDFRLHDHVTVFSGDVYLTNLFNRFFGQTIATGLTCANVTCGNLPGNVTPSSVPVYNQTNTNISNARFEGVELELRHLPSVGFGYQISGAMQKGYFYNLPPYFYCSVPGPGCTMDQNLNIISGQNTNGLPVGFYNISYNGNMRIPYAQANGEISYTFRNGAYLLLGDDYFGKNNSLNEAPFGLAYATIRYPVTQHVSLQLSGDNIFNAYPGYFPQYGGGVPIPLADGTTGATTGNVLGPATYRLVLMTRLP